MVSFTDPSCQRKAAGGWNRLIRGSSSSSSVWFEHKLVSFPNFARGSDLNQILMVSRLMHPFSSLATKEKVPSFVIKRLDSEDPSFHTRSVKFAGTFRL